jgi:hypothetical protein
MGDITKVWASLDEKGLIGRSSDTMLAVENHVLREKINRLEEQVEKQKKYILVLQQRLLILGESHFPRE